MAKISGTELRRAALELKIAQAVEQLQAARADGALEVLRRSPVDDEAEFHRRNGTPQPRQVFVYSPIQRVLRALENVAGTLDGDEEFSIEICDSRKVVQVEMRARSFETIEDGVGNSRVPKSHARQNAGKWKC